MKIVFLDMDGVMNGIQRWPHDAGRQWIDPDAVTRLNRITETTQAKIVISSTWRRFWDVKALLQAAGVKAEIVGATPYLPSKPRGLEISKWLTQDGRGVERFVILDDDDDMAQLSEYLVLTDFAWGLQDAHVEQAIVGLR